MDDTKKMDNSLKQQTDVKKNLASYVYHPNQPSLSLHDSTSITQHAVAKDSTHVVPTHITIQIEQRKFCLSLENLDSACRQKIVHIFAQKQYTLEELLTLFVTTLRDQSCAEQELMRILHILES